eukprot:TRINITY_DN9173_c0_g1_i1.p1 TRINITY_DN9173_c0_g1~~TRINITY_DN9173_c0_g1_i1.p1  ORF type:complete len:175 (+),score=28.31 TRINITY_DN9173_c0_g1_i1:60-584(+)
MRAKGGEVKGAGCSRLKVVFLDIDGVLLPFGGESSESLPNSTCLRHLKHILDQTNAKIILSSTWRWNEESVKLINRELVKCGMEEIFGMTGFCDVDYKLHYKFNNSSGIRAREIMLWVKEYESHHPLSLSYVILDDEDLSPFETISPHFVYITSQSGLTREDASKAIGLLNAIK